MNRSASFVASLVFVTCAANRVQVEPPALEQPPRAAASSSVGDSARAQVRAFVAAVKSQKFDAARELLAAHWRAQYSVERLSKDYALEPAAANRIARLSEVAEKGSLASVDGGVRLLLPDGSGPRLIDERGELKITSLEE